MKELFLDANAHVPLSEKALSAYADFISSRAGHGHPLSPSAIGRDAAMKLEDARSRIAKSIGAASPSNIVITSTCTQACEWACKILRYSSGCWENAFISPTEHPAMSQSFDAYMADYRNKRELAVDKDGVLKNQNIPKGSRVCCIHVQNETGIIQPLEKFNDSFLLSDLSQTIGKVPFKVSDYNIDIGVFAGHKFGGFMAGFIYIKDTDLWRSFGLGSRYFLDRPGTPDVASVVGTAVALEEALSTLEYRREKMRNFQMTLEKSLKELGFEVIGSDSNRSPNTTFVRTPFPGGGMDLLLKLSESKIYVGLGSACGSMYTGGSPLMQKLGRPSNGEDYLRISTFGQYDSSDALYLVDRLSKIYLKK
jgi:cysteine desulfurase